MCVAFGVQTDTLFQSSDCCVCVCIKTTHRQARHCVVLPYIINCGCRFEMMSQCWQYYPRYRPSFANLLESLQGDVKKNFFSVSWYYSQRDDDESDMDSDSLNLDDQHSECQPLHPGSIRSTTSSDQNLAVGDLDDDDDDIESGTHMKDIMLELAPPVPTRMGRGVSSELYNGHLVNGHHSGSESGETDGYDSPLLTNGISPGAHSSCESRSKATSSIISAGQPPPSYNSATQDHSIGADPTVWSAASSKANSCNGSANGHIHYGNNSVTSAC